MKKSILDFGKPLEKKQQRNITGGMPICLVDNSLPECDDDERVRVV
ncbi:hypothetical protein [Tenacibaculum jejuense]|nr:hypothetical protein [Tenacibaculum jejuense]